MPSLTATIEELGVASRERPRQQQAQGPPRVAAISQRCALHLLAWPLPPCPRATSSALHDVLATDKGCLLRPGLGQRGLQQAQYTPVAANIVAFLVNKERGLEQLYEIVWQCKKFE